VSLLYAYKRRLQGVVAVAPSAMVKEMLSANALFHQAAILSLLDGIAAWA